MPQSTNLNTTPYFEDFDPNKKFHKVLFKPGVPLQARELTTLQSILQDQIEKLGSSLYKEGAMVIPGGVSYDSDYRSVLIEDEYFGLPSAQLVDFIKGKTITGQSSGVKAKVINALTADQSEKGFTTLYVKYLNASSSNSSSVFEDDEILISNESFSIGGTVISENTDFAKCITNNATFIGSSAAINSGIYYAKGFFITVDPQEIILDQFGTTPSYKIGLQILENIVSSTSDSSLNDPSQGFSNFAAPGADRFKLEAKLVKKALNDDSVTDFIEILRVEEGAFVNFDNGNLNQFDFTLDNTLARRTFDASGNYEVKAYTFTKDECLDDGVNNGVYAPSTETSDGNIASSDLFEINVSPGKSYILGFELSTVSTTYVDIPKARTFKSIEDYITNTDARGFVFTVNNAPTSLQLNSILTGSRVVSLTNDTNNPVGYGIFVSIAENGSNYDVRLTGIKFLEGNSLNDVTRINFGGTPNYETNDPPSGGTNSELQSTSGRTIESIFYLNRENVIKSVEDISITDIRAYASGTLSNGAVTLNNVKFNSSNASDYGYILSDTANVGTVTFNADLQNEQLLVDVGNTSNNGNITVFGPQTIANPTEKLISYKPMSVVKLTDIATKYDINAKSLSLGVTRASKIRGVYIAPSATPIDEVIPNLTTSDIQSFKIGEIIEGITSGAKGRVIYVNGNTLYFVYESSLQFVSGEDIKSYKTELVSNITAVENGAFNVKNKFILNDGQTDHTFEFSSIEKVNSGLLIESTNEVYVVFDFFEDINPGAGSFATVNSYYNASLDEGHFYESGNRRNYWTDLIDFRLDQTKVVTGDGNPTNVYVIDSNQILANTNLTNFGNNNYNFLPNNQLLPEGYIQTDKTEYYLPTKNTLYISKTGEFFLKSFINDTDNDADSVYEVKNAMPLIDIDIPAYTRDINDVTFKRYKNRRYTMKDIGSIEERLENVEYYTQLSLLETDTANLFVPDNAGLNRLKNGFIVDNFTSHNIGEPRHPNYRCSMDFANGELRARHYTTNIPLTFKNGVEPTNYVKGNVLMLNYSDVSVIEQNFASGTENVNPFAVISWLGTIQVTPATDDWTDEIRLPETTTNVEGNFTAQAIANNVSPLNGGVTGTEWNNWQAAWTTEPVRVRERETTFPFNFVWRSVPRRRRIPRTLTRTGIRTTLVPRVDRQVLGDRVVDTTLARWKRSRNIEIVARRVKPYVQFYPFFDQRSISTYTTPRLLEIEMISGSFELREQFSLQTNVPGRFFRATCIAFDEFGSDQTLTTNPYTREPMPTVYSESSTLLNWDVEKTSLLDNNEGGYLTVNDIIVGETSGARARIVDKRFVSTENGDVFAGFFIPEPSDDGNPRWRTGESIVRFTDSPSDSRVPGIVDSEAEGTYSATGNILTKQQDVLLVRNAFFRREATNDTRVLPRPRPRPRPPRRRWSDPLAQTFLVPEEEGMFVSKIDTFFQAKDSVGLPVSMEIRTTANGYPSQEILGTVVLTPDQVNVSDDASAVTTFKFDNPVFLQGYQEYCFAILTSSVEYEMWISRMGDDDLNGNRITSQPYAGVLFKSQNASTWTAHQLEDLKFKIYRAEFDITETPTIEFENVSSDIVSTRRLVPDPIELLLNTGNQSEDYLTTPKTNTGYIKVNHANHGMHDPSSFVTIDGVSSGVGTNLGADWSGGVGDVITLSGSANTENLFKNTNIIGGAVGGPSNLAYIKIINSVYSYDPSQSTNQSGGTFTIQLTEQISGPIVTNGYSVDDNIFVEYYIINGVPLTQINKTHSNLRYITLDSYQIFLDVERNSTDNLSIGGSNVTATANTMFTNVLPQVTYQELEGTSVTADFRTTSGTSIGTSSFSDPTKSNIPPIKSYIKDSEYRSVNLNDNNYYTNPKLVASVPNRQNLMQNQSSADLRITLSSTSTKLSPVVDLERVSLITTSNRVSNITGNYKKSYFEDAPGETYTNIEVLPLEDQNDANYITKLVTLENPATALRIELAGWNPEFIGDIDVLVKLLSGEESNPNEIGWINLNNIPGNENIRGVDIFEDQKWNFDVTDLTPNANPFTSFQVKIRMRSNNQSFPPLIKDLRCIALA